MFPLLQIPALFSTTGLLSNTDARLLFPSSSACSCRQSAMRFLSFMVVVHERSSKMLGEKRLRRKRGKKKKEKKEKGTCRGKEILTKRAQPWPGKQGRSGANHWHLKRDILGRGRTRSREEINGLAICMVSLLKQNSLKKSWEEGKGGEKFVAWARRHLPLDSHKLGQHGFPRKLVSDIMYAYTAGRRDVFIPT